MRAFAIGIMLIITGAYFLYLDGRRRWNRRPRFHRVEDRVLRKIERDLRTHRGGHWRAP